jgi:hypothetical protein
MEHHQQRRRAGSFRQEDNEEDDVQFLTPHYNGDEGGPEPLDFSKLDLNQGDQGDDDLDEDEEERQQELIETRGRSRSRSVHANDDNTDSYIPDNIPKTKHGLSSEAIQEQLKKAGEKSPAPNAPVDRSGPLQHREVVALQKVSVYFFHYFLIFLIFQIVFRVWKKPLILLERQIIHVKTKKKEWPLMPKSANECSPLKIIYLPINPNPLGE